MHSKNQKRHGSPVPSRSPLVPMKPKAAAVAPVVAPSPGDTLAFRVPKDYPHSRFSKAPLAVYPPKGARNKTCVSLPVVSLEKMPCLSRAESAQSHVRLTTSSSPSASPLKPPSLTPQASQRSSEKLMNGRGTSGPSTPRSTASPSSLDGRPSPARSPLDRRPSSTPSSSPLDRKPSSSPLPSQRSGTLPPPSSPLEKKQQNGTKASSRSHKRLSGRVFDPNKHCGVQDPETKRPCTRSLTCKTHSLTHRRAVTGRRKHFDILLAEHKGKAKEKEGAKEKEKDRDGIQGEKDGGSQSIASQETTSPNKPHCPNDRPLSTLKLRLANAHIPRVPGSATSSPLPPAPAPATALAPNPEPSPHSWVTAAGDGGRLSSDEGDAETPEDTHRPGIHYSSHHPQPLGFCVFTSRLMGRGHYVFDRRWDRMRLALQSMVEKHLNAQMWRKVPLAPESLLSLPSSGTSSVTSQQAHPPSPSSVISSLLISPSNTFSCTATFPQSASMAGMFSIRDAQQPLTSVSAPAKSRNGTHKASRSSKEIEDSVVGSKKRKNPSSSSFSFSSSSFLTMDNHKRNGSSYHPTLQGLGGAAATPARKKGLGQGGSRFWSSGEDWLSRVDGSQSHNSQNSRDLGTTSISPSPNRELAVAPHQPLAPPSGALVYGGKAEGRKRRTPSSYKGKAGKLSRPGGLESLFGKGNDSGGILTSGPESPRQAKLHH
ncbi:hypothetical protein PAMA_013192 [Pampus argenteus]